MPRRSINEFTVRVNGSPPFLQPPSYLDAAEQQAFCDLVASCDPRHFVPSDLPLVVSYVQATMLARISVKKVGQTDDALAAWEKAVRLQAMLATRLRLAPQSRLDPKSAARLRQPQLGPRPWETEEDDDDGEADTR